MAGPFCFPIPKTSPPFALPNSAIWRACNRNIGLSVDPVSSHHKWAADIEETQGHKVNYPMIGDPQLKIAKLYDMLPAEAGETCEGRTPADNATVRNVFMIGPDKKIKLMLVYPMTSGVQLRRSAARTGFHAAHGQAPDLNAGELETRPRRHHQRQCFERRGHEGVPRRVGGAEEVVLEAQVFQTWCC